MYYIYIWVYNLLCFVYKNVQEAELIYRQYLNNRCASARKTNIYKKKRNIDFVYKIIITARSRSFFAATVVVVNKYIIFY